MFCLTVSQAAIKKISEMFKYNGEKISEDYLTVEKIPAHTYAVFKCTGTMPENEIPPATQVDIYCIKCDETVPNIFRHFQTYQQVFCLQHIGL